MAETSPARTDRGHVGNGPPDPGPLPTHRQRRGWRPPRRAVVIGLATIAAALAVTAMAALTNGEPTGDGTALQSVDGTSTTNPTPASTAADQTNAGPSAAGGDEDATTQTTDPARDAAAAGDNSADGADDEDATPATTGTTTAAADHSPAPELDDPIASTATGDAVDIAALTAFRERLVSIQLDPTRLTDTDVTDFAATLCTVAAVEDPAGYAAFRTDLAAEQAATGSLTAEDLADVIDAAVIAFCPSDAARLGLTD